MRGEEEKDMKEKDIKEKDVKEKDMKKRMKIIQIYGKNGDGVDLAHDDREVRKKQGKRETRIAMACIFSKGGKFTFA